MSDATPAGCGGSIPKFKCNLCGKYFSFKCGLSLHLRNIHGDLSKPAQCTVCLQYCKNSHALTLHMYRKFYVCFTAMIADATPAGGGGSKRKFKCNLCGRFFSFKGGLNLHFRNIHGECSKPIQCSICLKYCKNEHAVRMHIHRFHNEHSLAKILVIVATPTGIGGSGGKFKCNFCERSFSYKRGLTHHFRNIHGDRSKPVQCAVCLKYYNNRSALDLHMYRVHRRPYPVFVNATRAGYGGSRRKFKCIFCEKAFSYKRGLTQHFLNIHGERSNPMQCSICLNYYKNENVLRVHIHRTHKSQSNKEHQQNN
ncbi:hypothetical protein B566_EDAN006969 [Ephemera danica]|nr:hypothetical protein B566_EDAN006969 [Ephemera danica]